MQADEFIQKLTLLSQPGQPNVEELKAEVVGDQNFPFLVVDLLNNVFQNNLSPEKNKAFKIWCSNTLVLNASKFCFKDKDTYYDLIIEFLLTTEYNIGDAVRRSTLIDTGDDILCKTRELYFRNQKPDTFARYLYALSQVVVGQLSTLEGSQELLNVLCSDQIPTYIDPLPDHDIYKAIGDCLNQICMYGDTKKMVFSFVNQEFFTTLMQTIRNIPNTMESENDPPPEYFHFIKNTFQVLYKMRLFLTSIESETTVPFNLITDSLDNFQAIVKSIIHQFSDFPELCFNALDAIFERGVIDKAEEYISYTLLYFMLDFMEYKGEHIEHLLNIVYQTVGSLDYEAETENPVQYYKDYLTFVIISRSDIRNDVIGTSYSARQVAAVVFVLLFQYHPEDVLEWIQLSDPSEPLLFLFYSLYSAYHYFEKQMPNAGEAFEALDELAEDILAAEGDVYFEVSKLNLLAAMAGRGATSGLIMETFKGMSEESKFFPVVYTIFCRYLLSFDPASVIQFLAETGLSDAIVERLGFALSSEPYRLIKKLVKASPENSGDLVQQVINVYFEEAASIIEKNDTTLEEDEKLDSIFDRITLLVRSTVNIDFEAIVDRILSLASKCSDCAPLVGIGKKLFSKPESQQAYMKLVLGALEDSYLTSFIADILDGVINAIGKPKDFLTAELDGVPAGLVLFEAFGKRIINNSRPNLIEDIDLESMLIVMEAVALRMGLLSESLVEIAVNDISALLPYESLEEYTSNKYGIYKAILGVPFAIAMGISCGIELPQAVLDLTVFLAEGRWTKKYARYLLVAELFTMAHAPGVEDPRELIQIADDLLSHPQMNFELKENVFTYYLNNNNPQIRNIAPNIVDYIKEQTSLIDGLKDMDITGMLKIDSQEDEDKNENK